MNSAACELPLLSKALQFPQYGVRQKTVKLEPIPQPVVEEIKIGQVVGYKSLDLIFQGLALLTKPLQMLAGKTFATEKVTMDW